MLSNKESILGISISNETYQSLAKHVFDNIEIKKQTFVVAVNPEKIMKASEDAQLMDLINNADYQIPDGIGLLIASKINKGSITERITGIDLMMYLIKCAVEKNKKIFLYGGKPGVAVEASEKLLDMYPTLEIAGTLDGYIKNNETVKSVINEANPDLLFIAMGSPKQEKWIVENKDQLNVSLFQGVGGSFDVVAGHVKRAPLVFRKCGLEWLYRLLREPSRIKRQLVLPRFIFKVFFRK